MLLRVAPLDGSGEAHLLQLAEDRSLAAQQPVLDELLGDRAAALDDPPRAEIRPQRPQQRPRVDAGVLEEALVLGGENGAAQHLGDLRECHRPVRLARPGAHVQHRLALECRARAVRSVLDDARDPVAFDLQSDALGAQWLGAAHGMQENLPAVGVAVELPGRRRPALCLAVAEPRQCAGQAHEPDVDAPPQLLGGGIDDRGTSRLDPVKAREPRGGVGAEADDDETAHTDRDEQKEGPLAKHRSHGTCLPCHPVPLAGERVA